MRLMKTPPPGFWTVHQGDARKLEILLQAYSTSSEPLITCTITSPPYWKLKDYGHGDQIGWGQDYEDYLIDCRRILRALFRHTRSDGSLWLVADTLTKKESQHSRVQPLPFDLMVQAEVAGWILRDLVIWKKDKTLPWSSKGRFRNTFE